MKSFTVRQIIEATQGKLLNEDLSLLDISIDGVSTDSRTIKKGQLFIPLVGEIFDGHYFLDQVAEKGAKLYWYIGTTQVGCRNSIHKWQP